MNRYPLALYRPGSQMKIWGRDVDMLIVEDKAGEADAVQSGWSHSPDDEHLTVEPVKRGPGRPRKVVEASDASVE